MMVGICYAGPIEEGERRLRPLRACRSPLIDLVGRTSYVGFQSALDSTVVHGWSYYWKSTHLPELSDALIDVMVQHAFSCSSARSYAAMLHGDREIVWTRKFFSALGGFREGVYVNFLAGDEDPGRVREAYGDSVYARLAEVKTMYDPDNVFHHNQNIIPDAGASAKFRSGPRIRHHSGRPRP
jgi:hypothetical protein